MAGERESEGQQDQNRPQQGASSRREIFQDAVHAIQLGAASFAADGWDLLNMVVNRVGDAVLSRNRFLALATLTPIAIALTNFVESSGAVILVENPKLLSVWGEVQGLMNPPTNKDLLRMLEGHGQKIQLTPDQLQNLLFVGDGDSIYLPDGIRKNSLGFVQPGSWLEKIKIKINRAMQALGLRGKITAADFAQPGSTTQGDGGFESPEGNVQLGATTPADMADDKPGEITPTAMMGGAQGNAHCSAGNRWR